MLGAQSTVQGPSTFMCEVVYPLLERGATTLPEEGFTNEPRAFMASFIDPASDVDFILLSHALGGFARTDLPSAVPYRYMLADFGDVLTRAEDYSENRLYAKMRRHHAMVGAEALRWVFEATIASGGSGPLEG